jgi:hypothetical protein
MRKTTYILSILIFLVINAHGQGFKEYLKIYEGVNVGSQMKLSHNKIVDINATLSIKLNLDEIKKDYIDANSHSDTTYLKKLHDLEKVIQWQRIALEEFNNQGEVKFHKAYSSFRKALQNDNEILYNKFYALTKDASNSNGALNTYVYPLEHFLDDYHIERTQQSNTSGKTIALVANLIPQGKNVHVTNFDNIKEDFWISSNWDLSEVPSTLETEKINSVKHTVDESKQVLDGILKQEVEKLNVQELKKGLDLALKKLPGTKQSSALSSVELVKSQLDDLNSEILAPYSSSTERLLEDKLKLAESTLSQIKNLPGSIIQDIRKKLGGVRALNDSLFKPFQASIDKAEKSINDFEGHNINDVPEQAYIDLKGTGKRVAGDFLKIELIIRTNKPGKESLKNVVQQVSIQLQQVKVHAVANVGVILANPYLPDPNYKVETQFQLASCSNILFKIGSRKSKGWNFLQPGLGLNISAPDFDVDGTPDFSFGLVGSVFKDLLTTGISYNTVADEPFWFIGFSLPLANLALPIGNVQSVVNH